MIIFIVSLLYTVSAQSVYSRIYLRGLKQVEDERIQTDLIHRGIAYIENAVFTAAKQGLLAYTTEPFYGCELYTRPSELSPFGVDKTICKNVVNGIYALVSERFPDSQLLYDTPTKRYTLKWD